jgi:polar amino acid transport system substrate-binding protein
MQRTAGFAAMLVAMTAFTLPAAYAASETLVLVTAALPPLGSPPGQQGFLEQVAREAFRRIGRSVEVSTLPGERALINVDSGLEDGDLYRAPGFEKEYPNLVRVPEKMGDMEFMAYAKRPDIQIHAWSDLQPYVVAYATGWKIYDRMVKAREVTKVRIIDDLFPLLASDRADIILIDRWQGMWAARADGYNPRVIEPPLAHAEMFMYLNKRHAAIVPELARALADMKADGTYRKISDAALRLTDEK